MKDPVYSFSCALSVALSIFASAPTQAQQIGDQESNLQDAESRGVLIDKGSLPSIELCWSNWLKEQGLEDGKNDINGHLIIVSHQQQAVNQDPSAHNWLGARKFAFETAEIQARGSLAETMKTVISSSRSAAQQMLGGDDAAPSLKTTVQQLSIADKTNVLIDKALDNEIVKYDPTWNKTASDVQKRESIMTLQARMQDNIATHAELYASGAFTVVQCEGQSKEDNGKYSVLVGMIWSPKLAKVAESIWNPRYKLPPEPAQVSMTDRFAAFGKDNPMWLAYTMGARVFTNEKGERVVVGFGVAPQSSMMSADKRRASLDALAAIDHFVGEKIEANAEASDSFEQRDYNNGDSKFFDTSAYNNRINLRAKDLKLQGTVEVLSWRGSHPFSGAKMQVVAMAWSPSWSADSEQAAKLMQSIEQRMNQEGAVPASGTATQRRFNGAGSAAPSHAGASSTTRDF